MQKIYNQIKVEGINCRGFGVLPKFVMLDTDLTIEAKGIYAYFCSFAGNGTGAFPGRDKILFDLKMGKSAYYRHFHMLTEQGYITVEQKFIGGRGNGFGKNTYTLISNPKKYAEQPAAADTAAASRSRVSGIKAAGYGIIPKAVMQDERLPIQTKAIYAYFCSFAGNGSSACPEKRKSLHFLGISETTYYRYYSLLKEYNYIIVKQRRVNGRLTVNDYYLNDNPGVPLCANPAEEAPYPRIQDTVNSGDLEQSNSTVLPATDSQNTTRQNPRNKDTNINSVNNNKAIINNHSFNLTADQNSDAIRNDGMNDGQAQQSNEDLAPGEIAYSASKPEIRAAIRQLAEWDTFSNGYADPLEQAVYKLCVDELILMCSAARPMAIKNMDVLSVDVIDRVNSTIRRWNGGADIMPVINAAIAKYYNVAKVTTIHNAELYMRTVIWDALLTADAAEESDLMQL